MLFCGIGLFFRVSSAWSSRVLFLYLFVWLLLKVPALIVAPSMEAVWLNFGEIAVLFVGGWVLFATLADVDAAPVLAFVTGPRGVRLARLLFDISLIPIGLSHIFYTNQTVDLIPAWLPFRTGLAYLTGAGQIICGLAVLFSIFLRFAALLEAGLVASSPSSFGFLESSPHLQPDFRGQHSSSPGSLPRVPGSSRAT